MTVLLPVGTFTFAAGTVLRWATLRTVLVTEEYPDPSVAGTVTDSGVVGPTFARGVIETFG